MAHFHTAEGFPSAQERPDECVFSFQKTREVFCLTPLNSTKEQKNETPFSKNFLFFLSNKKSSRLTSLEVKQEHTEKPHRELISVG